MVFLNQTIFLLDLVLRPLSRWLRRTEKIMEKKEICISLTMFKLRNELSQSSKRKKKLRSGLNPPFFFQIPQDLSA